MISEKTNLSDCWVIKPSIIKDNRGFFYENFNKNKLKDLINLDFTPVQVNGSKSSRGVLRGLHFQKNPMAQGKIIFCIQGEVLDVAVDLRTNSKSYGQYFSVRLNEENKNSLFVPKGMAHGFVVLSKTASVMYLIDEFYDPKSEAGIIYNDSDINVDWNIPEEELILSDKDKELPLLKETNLNF